MKTKEAIAEKTREEDTRAIARRERYEENLRINQEFWDDAIHLARVSSPEATPAEHEIWAEMYCLDKGYIPPSWKDILYCESCGAMPSDKLNAGTHVEACPWCHSEHMQNFKRIIREERDE